MQLSTTYRGLNQSEAGLATRILEKHTSRLEKLLERPTSLRVVVDGSAPEHRVILTMLHDGIELTSQSSGYELAPILIEACERMRAQVVRSRNRRETLRHKRAA